MDMLKDKRYQKACDWRIKLCKDETCEKGLCKHILAQKGISPQLLENLKLSKEKKVQTKTRGFTSCTVEITQADFDALAGFPYEITSPGNYCLAEDITYSPPGSFFTAFLILVDNVTIDLKGFRLQGDGTASTSGIIIGDFFGPPLSNIEIKNGSVLNFTRVGIWSIALSQLFGDGPYKSLSFTDLDVLDCGSNAEGLPTNGINLDSLVGFSDPSIPPNPSNPNNVAYQNVIIKRCKVNRTVGTGAVRVWYGQNVTLENVEANNTTSISDNTPNFLTGEFWDSTSAYTIVGNNVSLTSCQGNNTRHLENPFGQASGIFLFDTIGVFMKDCQFNNTFSDASFLTTCANLSNCQDINIINCQFNNVSGGSQCFLLDGAHLSDAPGQTTNAQSLKFTNCQFNGVSVIAEELPTYEIISRGFFALTSKNLVFDGCEFGDRNLNYLQNSTATGLVFSEGFIDQANVEFANVQNVTVRKCVISNIVTTLGAAGVYCVNQPASRTGEQASLCNVVLDDCVIQNIHSSSPNSDIYRIMGIGWSTFFGGGVSGQVSDAKNLTIKNCSVMDVKHFNEELSDFSAGILIESVRNPILCNNNVQACDRGILFTGTNNIIPNGFQLANSKEESLEKEFIDLDVSLVVIGYIPSTDETLGPFNAVLAGYSPLLTGPVTATGGLASPDIEACVSPLDPLTGQIGVASRGSCNFTSKTQNIEDAGGIATIIFQNNSDPPFIMSGPPTGTGPSVMISANDGLEIVNAINTHPLVELTIISLPTTQNHTFTKIEDNTSVTVPIEQVDDLGGFENNFVIVDPDDMKELGWKTGDAVVYVSEDPSDPIPPLVSGQTYYLITYSPGFTDCGLVQDNKVNSCSYSGYQDNRCPTTSAFISNTAYNNGDSHRSNYKIHWGGDKPVCRGDLSCYPECPRPLNLSLVKSKKHCKSRRSKHKKCHRNHH